MDKNHPQADRPELRPAPNTFGTKPQPQPTTKK